jgi:predicted RNA-binding Zn ribbon-like protein
MATDPSGAAEYRFELTGGQRCLDFVNTVSGDRGGVTRERLGSYADLLAWARQAEAVDAAHARRLLAESRRRPADAEAVHREAIALREALYRVFTAIAERREPAGEDLAAASAFLSRALAHRRLARADGRFALSWDDPPGALDAPLWRVAASAADVLTSPEQLERVRVCGMHETHECGWVFLDTTKARTRRWCSMKDCGNKAKARRHYARTRGE